MFVRKNLRTAEQISITPISVYSCLFKLNTYVNLLKSVWVSSLLNIRRIKQDNIYQQCYHKIIVLEKAYVCLLPVNLGTWEIYINAGTLTNT